MLPPIPSIVQGATHVSTPPHAPDMLKADTRLQMELKVLSEVCEAITKKLTSTLGGASNSEIDSIVSSCYFVLTKETFRASLTDFYGYQEGDKRPHS